MILLAIETTGPRASVALSAGGPGGFTLDGRQEIHELHSNEKFNHLKDLIPMVERLLQEHGLKTSNVTHIAVSAGPGSFTGIRIGVATARALAQALKLDVIKVPTLETFVYNDVDSVGDVICPIFDARRNQIYAGAYKQNNDSIVDGDVTDCVADGIVEIIPGGAYYPNDFFAKLKKAAGKENIRYYGDGADIFVESHKNNENYLQTATSVAQWAFNNLEKAAPYAELEPIYMRQAEAQRKFDEARTTESVVVREAESRDVDAMAIIDVESFEDPWHVEAFESEVNTNAISRYLVAELDGKVVAYAGLWSIVDEGHITNVAVSKDYRRRGIAKHMVKQLIDWTRDEDNLKRYTLEVRESNIPAINLYKTFGFKEAGKRVKYYQDKEDAVIMWKEK